MARTDSKVLGHNERDCQEVSEVARTERESQDRERGSQDRQMVARAERGLVRIVSEVARRDILRVIHEE